MNSTRKIILKINVKSGGSGDSDQGLRVGREREGVGVHSMTSIDITSISQRIKIMLYYLMLFILERMKKQSTRK
jgi:hypothetical protein